MIEDDLRNLIERLTGFLDTGGQADEIPPEEIHQIMGLFFDCVHDRYPNGPRYALTWWTTKE